MMVSFYTDCRKQYCTWVDREKLEKQFIKYPFLEDAVKIKKGDPGYGEPIGLTKQRGNKAKKHIHQVISTGTKIT